MGHRLTYDAMADTATTLQIDYMNATREVPPSPIVVMPDGYPTTKGLLALWQAHRVALLAAFEEGGWTEDEYDDATDAAFDAMA